MIRMRMEIGMGMGRNTVGRGGMGYGFGRELVAGDAPHTCQCLLVVLLATILYSPQKFNSREWSLRSERRIFDDENGNGNGNGTGNGKKYCGGVIIMGNTSPFDAFIDMHPTQSLANTGIGTYQVPHKLE